MKVGLRISDSGKKKNLSRVFIIPCILSIESNKLNTSVANNLVASDTNAANDIFIYDRINLLTERVSIGTGGTQSNASSTGPAIASLDGRFIAFGSNANNLVPNDTNNTTDIFVRDRQTNTTKRVSVSSNGIEADNVNQGFSMSEDGKYIAFQSSASNLVTGVSGTQIYLHDQELSQTILVSMNSNSQQGNGISDAPSVAGDGGFIAFQSSSGNLVAGDINGLTDVFLAKNTLISTVDPLNPLALIQDSFNITRHVSGEITKVTALSNNKDVFLANYDSAARMITMTSGNYFPIL